jgi:hypothetical protein
MSSIRRLNFANDNRPATVARRRDLVPVWAFYIFCFMFVAYWRQDDCGIAPARKSKISGAGEMLCQSFEFP